MGVDDPKGIPVVKWLMTPTYLALPVSLAGAGLLTYLLLAAVVDRKWAVAIRLAGLLGFVTLVWFIALADPAQALVWFRD